MDAQTAFDNVERSVESFLEGYVPRGDCEGIEIDQRDTLLLKDALFRLVRDQDFIEDMRLWLTLEDPLAVMARVMAGPLCEFCKKPGCPPDCMGHYP